LVQGPGIRLEWLIVYQIASNEITLSVLVVALLLVLSVVAGIAGYRYHGERLSHESQKERKWGCDDAPQND
jgi:hypothetical protein